MTGRVERLEIDGRPFEVWGKAPTATPASRHDLCWTVTASPHPRDAIRTRRYFTYPHAFICPIQAMPGWVGVHRGLGHEVPFDAGWLIRPADVETAAYGYAQTPQAAWQIAAEALHRSLADLLGSVKGVPPHLDPDDEPAAAPAP